MLPHSHDKDCSTRSCSFCDRFLHLIESSFEGKTCQLGSRLVKILLDNKEALLENVHHRNEDFADLYDSLEANPDHTSPPIKCKFCTLPECLSHEAYLQHLNQHYVDIYSVFKKYYVKKPVISRDTPIVCPICSKAFNQDPNELRSWVSKHFYECGDPIRCERMETLSKVSVSSRKSSKIIKCGWCEGPFLHRTSLKTHMETCSKRLVSSQVEEDPKKASLSKVLLRLTKECDTCNNYEDILGQEDESRRSEFVKHALNNHAESVDKLDLSFKELSYLSELLEHEPPAQESDGREVSKSVTEDASSPSTSKPKKSHLNCVFCKDESNHFTTNELKLHYARCHYKSKLIPKQASYPSKCTESACSTTLYNELDAAKHLGLYHGYLCSYMLNHVSNPEAQEAAMVLFLQVPLLKIQETMSKPYKCPICSYGSVSALFRMHHLCRHYRVELLKKAPMNGKLTCELKLENDSACGLTFKNSFLYLIHVGVGHRLLADILTANDLDFDELKKTIPAKKTPVAPPQCQNCKEIFASKEHLSLHTCNSIFDKASQVSPGSRKKNTSGNSNKRDPSVYNISEYLSDVSEDEPGGKAPEFQCTRDSCKLFFPNEVSLNYHYEKTSHNLVGRPGENVS